MKQEIDLSDFRYTSVYTDPDHSYYGNAAIHFIISDLITFIFRNRTVELGCEVRYFSHVAGIKIDSEYWVFSIDIDLLDIDNTIEIIAVNRDKTRIHLKGNKWFDNINDIKGNISKRNALVASKVVKCMRTYIKDIYKDRNKKYCSILSEAYASDFED